MADQSPISLSTGKKVYSLEYAFDYNAFIRNTTGHGCTAFCKYLGNSSSDPSSPLAFHVHGEGRRISHQLLKDDGFFLGKWCKDEADGGIDPAYCAVFEVPTEALMFCACRCLFTRLCRGTAQSCPDRMLLVNTS